MEEIRVKHWDLRYLRDIWPSPAEQHVHLLLVVLGAQKQKDLINWHSDALCEDNVNK